MNYINIFCLFGCYIITNLCAYQTRGISQSLIRTSRYARQSNNTTSKSTPIKHTPRTYVVEKKDPIVATSNHMKTTELDEAIAAYKKTHPDQDFVVCQEKNTDTYYMIPKTIIDTLLQENKISSYVVEKPTNIPLAPPLPPQRRTTNATDVTPQVSLPEKQSTPENTRKPTASLAHELMQQRGRLRATPQIVTEEQKNIASKPTSTQILEQIRRLRPTPEIARERPSATLSHPSRPSTEQIQEQLNRLRPTPEIVREAPSAMPSHPSKPTSSQLLDQISRLRRVTTTES